MLDQLLRASFRKNYLGPGLLLLILTLFTAPYLPSNALANGHAAAPPEGSPSTQLKDNHDDDQQDEQDQDGADQDRPPAAEPLILESPFEALETACVEQRDANACLSAGRSWRQGKGVEKPNLQQAAALLEAGCRFGSADSCTLVARMYLEMEAGLQFVMPEGTVSLDLGAAADSFQRACSLGALQACGMWGDLYLNPRALLPRPEAVARNIQPDMIQAIQAWTQGCNEIRAPELSDIARPGQPPQADTRSCLRLAQLTELGKGGIRKNPSRSAELYRRACYASGDPKHCAIADRIEAGRTSEQRPGAGEGRPASVSPRADAPTDSELITETTSAERRSVQPHRPAPKVGRFTETKTGLLDPEKRRIGRFEVEFGLGARWLYQQPSHAGIQFRLGLGVWFGLLGIGLESGFHTDNFLQPSKREYLRFQQSLSLKLALPIPIQAEKFHGELYLVFGAGGTLGALELAQEDFMPSWGARQMVQLVAVTHSQHGPRQWGALRFEQQQSAHRLSNGSAEHSSQIVLLFGFTFGGPGPSLPGARIKKEPWRGRAEGRDPDPEPGTGTH